MVSEWNEIAQKTLLADTTKALPEDFLYMGLVQAAVLIAQQTKAKVMRSQAAGLAARPRGRVRPPHPEPHWQASRHP